MSLYVEFGPVVAKVKGGLFRSSSIDQPLLLDASDSADLSIDPQRKIKKNSTDEKLLTFSWTCSIVSIDGYGKSCLYIFQSEASLSSPKVTIVNMTLDFVYLVNVVARAVDGRDNSASVTVTATQPGSAKVKIRSSFTKFNSESTLKLVGDIRAGSAQTSSWSVLDPDVNLSIDSLTPVSKNFSDYEAKTGVLFPLAVAPDTFYPGKMYTFRLTSFSRNDSSIIGFGDIVLHTNAPPSSGSLVVSPANGTAVLTAFSISAVSWIDDPDDYPISYVFLYSLSEEQGDFTLAGKSEVTFTTSSLPAGLSSMNGTLFSVVITSLTTIL